MSLQLLTRDFYAQCGEETVHFRLQSALQHMTHAARAAQLERGFLEYDIPKDEAFALAYNCVLLYDVLYDLAAYHPFEVLEEFSLGQIAALCRLYCEHASTPPANIHAEEGWDEFGFAGKEDAYV